MSVLDILIIPDKRLKYKSSIVEVFDENLHEIVKNMYDTLYSSGNGIGLAAPQVAIFKRIVVIDLKENGNSNPITFINPRIISSSNENAKNEEGCLSFFIHRKTETTEAIKMLFPSTLPLYSRQVLEMITIWI